MDRRSIGSWLAGPRAAAVEAGVELGYPGQRLGLPEEGPGSIASFPRRLGAIIVDWLLCVAIARGLLGGGAFTTLGIFALENLLLVGTLGVTVGMRLAGVRVARPDGGVPRVWAVVVRTALLCLAVPAMLWDRDHRGLHDRASGTAVLRT
ncbi:MAG: RDD family protein [Carbonactinosporaceae bacterium]